MNNNLYIERNHKLMNHHSYRTKLKENIKKITQEQQINTILHIISGHAR